MFRHSKVRVTTIELLEDIAGIDHDDKLPHDLRLELVTCRLLDIRRRTAVILRRRRLTNKLTDKHIKHIASLFETAPSITKMMRILGKLRIGKTKAKAKTVISKVKNMLK